MRPLVFPQDNPDNPAGKAREGGMELRDYFAAQALGALGGHKAVGARGIPWLVDHAYMIADAMLAARDA
jgi:hypothetical protein